VVIFDQDLRGSVEGVPRFQALSGLAAELCELARQGEAGPDAQVAVYGVSPHVDLVAEPVPVTGSHRVLNLDRLPLAVIDGPQNAEYGDTRRQS
jgi:hypothetical protein